MVFIKYLAYILILVRGAIGETDNQDGFKPFWFFVSIFYFWRFSMDWKVIAFRLFLAVIIGGFIGTERARHGRAAGMRTHILVCLGSALTAMTGIYVNDVWGTGDVLRISAQVISGIGFLGAGMIILKNGNVVTGLTTAAGMWTTATIGIALGYGFYEGAGIVAVLFFISLVFFARLERRKRYSEIIYVEIDDVYQLNQVVEDLKKTVPVHFKVSVLSPRSGKDGNVGINLVLQVNKEVNFEDILKIKNIVYAVEE